MFVTWNGDDAWEFGKSALYFSAHSLGLQTYTIQGVEYCSLLDFCKPLDQAWLKEQLGAGDGAEGVLDAGARQKLELHKEFADYFQAQIELYCEMLVGRSYSAIYALENILPFNLLLSVVFDVKMPYEVRSQFVKLIIRLWVDRFPHEPNCGKQSLPELIWVASELEDLAIDHPKALPHFELATQKPKGGKQEHGDHVVEIDDDDEEFSICDMDSDPFYDIASADKFQMLTTFIITFFKHIDRQVIQ